MGFRLVAHWAGPSKMSPARPSNIPAQALNRHFGETRVLLKFKMPSFGGELFALCKGAMLKCSALHV